MWSSHPRFLSPIDGKVDLPAYEARSSIEHDDPRRLIRGSGLDFIGARLQKPYGAVGDLDALYLARPAQLQMDAAYPDANLDYLVA
jgi:hypothetical protein